MLLLQHSRKRLFYIRMSIVKCRTSFRGEERKRVSANDLRKGKQEYWIPTGMDEYVSRVAMTFSMRFLIPCEVPILFSIIHPPRIIRDGPWTVLHLSRQTYDKYNCTCTRPKPPRVNIRTRMHVKNHKWEHAYCAHCKHEYKHIQLLHSAFNFCHMRTS